MSEHLDLDVANLAGEFGPFDGVIVSVASWGGQGRKAALDLTDQEWQDLLDGNLTSVFRLFRAFLPHVTFGGAMMQLNGLSADLPFPGSAGVALSAAATKSLTVTLAAELNGQGPRVHQLVLGVVRTRARQRAGSTTLVGSTPPDRRPRRAPRRRQQPAVRRPAAVLRRPCDRPRRRPDTLIG